MLCVSVLSSYVDSTREILYVYIFYVYMHTYRNRNFEIIDIKRRNIELVVTFYVYAHTHKEIKKTDFWAKRETHPKDMQTLTFAI